MTNTLDEKYEGVTISHRVDKNEIHDLIRPTSYHKLKSIFEKLPSETEGGFPKFGLTEKGYAVYLNKKVGIILYFKIRLTKDGPELGTISTVNPDLPNKQELKDRLLNPHDGFGEKWLISNR